MSDLYQTALEEAKLGRSEGGIPIGAAITRGPAVLGRGHNLRLQSQDPTAHAEAAALRSAGLLDNYGDTTLYTTYRPCFMCAGTILLFKIPKVVVGQIRAFPRRESRDGENASLDLLYSHGVEVTHISDAESEELLESYAASNLVDWQRDNGEPVDQE